LDHLTAKARHTDGRTTGIAVPARTAKVGPPVDEGSLEPRLDHASGIELPTFGDDRAATRVRSDAARDLDYVSAAGTLDVTPS